ncbi:UNVERIFIED_CONTAM: PI-PLC X domain-containing protein [Sesamum radiatum]|uniref:PI-PLC X domain-containing protein n=1 Tax=Sesamum radiatum TaxID=300843 RepID=A0AAW2RCX6_SESRA
MFVKINTSSPVPVVVVVAALLLTTAAVACSPGTCRNNSLPFNKYAFLTTHNAFAVEGEPYHTGVPRITLTNQEDTVTQQLNKPAVDTLKEIESFLRTNPSEIVTLFLQDYVQTPKGISKVLREAGLSKYRFPLSRMPRNGEDWPTVTHMLATNQRLLVFTSVQSKEKSEGIAYQWNYMVENQYGDDGMIAGSCTNRMESSALNDKRKSLVLMNYFGSIPSKKFACVYNSANLLAMIRTCHQATGGRWPNFVAVDFYKVVIT